MLTPSRAQTFYLSHFSKPASDRLVYRTITAHQPLSILELGIGVGQRAVRMIGLAGRFHPPQDVHYTGIDLFEARSAADGPGVTIKMAHRLLKATGARTRLVPGDPFSGLSAVANSLGKIDLVVISSRWNPRDLSRAWFYLPRILHARSQVVLETTLRGGGTSSRRLDRQEIETLAAAASPRRAA